jgi:hypothetical protein
MKIGADKVAEYQHGDVTVFVRAKASAADKVLVESMAKAATRDLLEGNRPKLSRNVAMLFVCGWHGVQTQSGHDVPYSWAALEAVLEPEVVDDLGKFACRVVDILQQ